MKKFRILAVAPYPGMKDLFLSIANSMPGVDIEVFTRSLENPIEYAKIFAAREFDIIISRGGTAKRIKAVSSIPLIEVEVSVYDMLRAIKMAYQHNRKFAIVGYSNITKPAKMICDILKYDIDIYEIKNSDESYNLLLELSKSQTDLVVGDIIITEFAGQLGINSILVTSGRESVEKAFQSAIDLLQNISRAQNANILFKSIADRNRSGIMLFDESEALRYSNSALDEFDILKLKNYLAQYIGRLKTENEIRLLKKYENYLLDITGMRILSGAAHSYIFYISHTASHAIGSVVCQTIENFDDARKTSNFILSGSEYMSPVLEKINKLGSSSQPVFIYGETGTGKDAVAKYIHLNSIYKNSPMVTIDCEVLTEKQWQLMVDDVNSPINSKGCAIFFKNVHTLSTPLQKALDVYIEDTLLLNRHRIFSSAICSIHGLVSKSAFLQSLYLKLYNITIYMPSLNERPDDIPALAGLCISEFNIEFSKQVIGFDTEAIELLKNFQWQLNLDQLQKIVKQLVSLACGYYISAKAVREVLADTVNQTGYPAKLPFDLTKSLDEIEKSIINYVICEENQNQSKAAKRLGISRSTMWRKLSTRD